MTFDLTKPGDRKKLAEQIKSEIDQWCVENYDDGPRKHLGASLIGQDCSRYLWYVFRWAKHHRFDGRMLRLFNRGHLEEPRFIGWLQATGWKVKFVEDDGKQMRISGVGGHFGGSLDGEATPPERYGLGTLGITFVNEFKTNGPSPTFTKMTNSGVQIIKPEHFAQMSVYGRKRNHRYGLYMMVNKSDENLHIEIVPLDWNLADRLELKAGAIIMSKTPPAKLSESASHQACVYCDMKGICHKGENYEKNCRSCHYAEARPGPEWYCNGYQMTIPEDFIPKGCDNYQEAR